MHLKLVWLKYDRTCDRTASAVSSVPSR